MSAAIVTGPLEREPIGRLLAADVAALRDWSARWEKRRGILWLAIICAGAGLYGAAMGCWRSPVQAAYVAVKFPMIILLTTLGNALLNAMLAPLLGLNITLKQSLLVMLMSFTIASAILGAFSPLAAFLVWNAPSLSSAGHPGTYGFIQSFHVFVIAFAGLAANVRLGRLLNHLGGNRRTGRRVLVAWVAGNLFLGSQLCW